MKRTKKGMLAGFGENSHSSAMTGKAAPKSKECKKKMPAGRGPGGHLDGRTGFPSRRLS
jgi:hypothetical protein